MAAPAFFGVVRSNSFYNRSVFRLLILLQPRDVPGPTDKLIRNRFLMARAPARWNRPKQRYHGQHNGKMVTLVRQPKPEYAVDTGLAPLVEVANAEHLLPPEYINQEGNGMTEAFLEYARPLIGGPLPPYGRLASYRVERRLHS